MWTVGSDGSASVLVTRLHATLDALLALDLSALPEGQVPQLVEQLVRAGHRLHAAQLDAIAALDAAGLPATSRHRSTARWVAERTRLGAGPAAAMVHQARALGTHLPATHEALAEGQISAGHAGAVAQVVRLVGVQHAVAAEPVLLDLARRADPSVVRRAAAHLHAVLDPDGAQAALDKAHGNRGVTLSVMQGRAYLHGVLDVESAEVVQTALLPLMAPSPGETRSAPQRRADALVDLARRALDAADLPLHGGQRPHLSIVLTAEALTSGRGAATLPATGAAVPVPTVARWACDAQLTPIWAAAATRGLRPLAVGRSSRTVTPAQLKALQVRDGGCVHPGCTRTPAFCDAHHVVHWAEGGATDLENLVLLCRHHHRTLHAGHWSLVPATPAHAPPDQAEVLVHDWAATLPGGHAMLLQTAADRSPPLRPAM